MKLKGCNVVTEVESWGINHEEIVCGTPVFKHLGNWLNFEVVKVAFDFAR